MVSGFELLYLGFYLCEKELIMKKIIKYKNILMTAILLLSICSAAKAQVDSLALSILDKAIGFVYTKGAGAIYYETVAQNVADPMDIFSLPLYKVDKGGHWFLDGNKFEIKTAGTKALCDGKQLSIIDEETQIMYVDSVREEPLIKPEDDMLSYDEMLDEQFGDGQMAYLGEEEVKGIPCHKIQANMEKMAEDYILYWISKKDHQLKLMAEKTDDLYTVYEIKKVGEAPKNYNYTLVLPKEEMTEFHGFQVVDMRFARDFLNSTGESEL